MDLVRIEPERGLWRWYSAYVREDLFDAAVLIRRWGRLGASGGHETAEPFDTWEKAEAARQRTIAAKLRRGYRYSQATDRLPEGEASTSVRSVLPSGVRP